MSDCTIGIDLGSRATKILWLEHGAPVRTELFDTGHDPIRRVLELLKDAGGVPVVATGYGRNLVRASLACPTVTEILACARRPPRSEEPRGGKECRSRWPPYP